VVELYCKVTIGYNPRREYGGDLPSQYRAAKSELLASYGQDERPF
jgi:hypothetical protein